MIDAATLARAPASAWNAFAFKLGERLLVALADHPGAKAHVLEIAMQGIAAVGAAENLIRDGEKGTMAVAMIEATLRPMAMMDGSSAASLLLRIFRWGTRRVRQDRRVADSLVTLANEACEVHAELAGLAGQNADAARDVERAAQRDDAEEVLGLREVRNPSA